MQMREIGIKWKILLPFWLSLVFLFVSLNVLSRINIRRERQALSVLNKVYAKNMLSAVLQDRQRMLEKAADVVLGFDESIEVVEAGGKDCDNAVAVLAGAFLSIEKNMKVSSYALYDRDFKCVFFYPEDSQALGQMLPTAYHALLRSTDKDLSYTHYYAARKGGNGQPSVAYCAATPVLDFDDQVIGYVEMASGDQVFLAQLAETAQRMIGYRAIDSTTFGFATDPGVFEAFNTDVNNETELVDQVGEQFYESSTLDVTDPDDQVLGRVWVTANATETIAANRRSSLVMTLVIGGTLLVSLALGIFVTRALRTITRPIMEGLPQVSEQISSASTQISSSSQQVADAASQQATRLDETVTSLNQISDMIKQNASNAGNANKVMESTTDIINAGVSDIGRMDDAIGRIKDSSLETAKIIKTIDEIAFQTNLLALNAAVEAARAGEAGKGFAVVAEEVRNLAQRSAEAARSTSGLIEGAQKNAEDGVSVAADVSQNLRSLHEAVSEAATMISEIANASKDQAREITQIHDAVSEMEGLVQQNASTSEESASAAEELSAQAGEMISMVDFLTQKVNGGTLQQGEQHKQLPASFDGE